MATRKLDFSVLFSIINKASGPINKIKGSFSSLGAKLDTLKGKFAGVKAAAAGAGNKMIGMGKNLSAKVTLPILALGAAAFKSSMTFNKGMANVSTLLSGNPKSVASRTKVMSDAVLKMAGNMGIATSNLTAGLYQTVSAFGDGGNAIGKLQLAAKGAKSGLATTTDSINLLSAVTKGYGDKSLPAMKIAMDRAFTTVKDGQTNFTELASGMQMVVPIASSMKISQKELFTIFSATTGAIGKTSVVATSLKAAMQNISKSGPAMTKVIKAAGFASGDAMVKKLGLVGAMRKLKEGANGDTVAFKKLFASIEAQGVALSLTGAQAKDFDKKLKNMEKAAGATDKAFEAQTEGVNKAGFAWDKFKVKLNVFMIKVGNVLGPIINKIVDAVSYLIDMFLNIPKPIQAVIGVIAAVAAAAGPALVIFGYLSKAFVAIKAALLLLTPAIGILAIKIILITGIIIGLVYLAKYIINNWDKVKQFFINLWGKIVRIFKVAIQIISAAFPPLFILVQIIKKNWTKIKKFFVKLWKKIIVIFKRAVKAIKKNIGPFTKWVAKAWGDVVGVVTKLWAGVMGIFESIWGGVKSVIDGIVTFAENAWKTVSNIFTKVMAIAGKIADFMGATPIPEKFLKQMKTGKSLAKTGMNAVSVNITASKDVKVKAEQKSGNQSKSLTPNKGKTR